MTRSELRAISPPVAPGVHHLQRGRVGVGREADFHIVGVWPNDRDLLNFTAERCRPFSFLSKVTDSAASRSRPLYPQKRTFVSAAGTSARCQRQTSFQTGITELVRRAHTRPTCAILNCFQRGGSMRGSCPRSVAATRRLAMCAMEAPFRPRIALSRDPQQERESPQLRSNQEAKL
jgi:hypothetical protein